MKKLALIASLILIISFVSLNKNNEDPINSPKIDSMTGKIIRIFEDELYVEVLTGLHFDKAIVRLSDECELDMKDLSKYNTSDILVFNVSYIDNSTGQAIITTNNIVSLKDKMTQ